MFVQVFHYSPLAVGLGSSESTESDGRISVATVTGDVDESVRAEFSHTLADAVDDTSNAVVIDLSHVDFLGVSGALALAEVYTRPAIPRATRLREHRCCRRTGPFGSPFAKDRRRTDGAAAER